MAFPCGCSAWLAGFQGQVSRHGGGTKEEGSQGQRIAFYDLALRSYTFLPHFFIRRKSLMLAHIQRERNLTLLFDERNIKDFFGHVLKPSFMSSQCPPP